MDVAVGRGPLSHAQDDQETVDPGLRFAPAFARVAVVGTRRDGALACRRLRVSAAARAETAAVTQMRVVGGGRAATSRSRPEASGCGAQGKRRRARVYRDAHPYNLEVFMRRTILTAAVCVAVLAGLVTGSAGAKSHKHPHARAAQAAAPRTCA